MTYDVDTAWIAGVLEGEGSFTLSRMAKSLTARIDLGMTDIDVVARVRDAAGGIGGAVRARSIVELRPLYMGNPRKMVYQWTVTGEPAIALMWRILPFMGSRRTDRILEVIGRHHESRMKACVRCGREFYFRAHGQLYQCPNCPTQATLDKRASTAALNQLVFTQL